VDKDTPVGSSRPLGGFCVVGIFRRAPNRF
jgi:hypothetical protein